MNLQLFKKKILLFGGSFDPIHNGHINILKAAIKEIKPFKTYLIPSYISPLKDKINISNNDKLQMINNAIEGINNVEVIDYELRRQQKTYFIETINFLKSNDKDKKNKYIMLLGQDQLHNLLSWKNLDEVMDNIFKLYIYKRNHDFQDCKNCKEIELKFKNKIKYIKSEVYYDTSSTKIREVEVKENDLNPKNLEYINNHGLYAFNRISKFCSQSRVQHSLRVASFCKDLARIHNESLEEKAFLAGIYHDIAKNIPEEEQVEYAENLNIKNYPSWKVLHPYIGADILKKKFLINDKDVLQAITRHTLPFLYFENQEPSLLDKILYVADKLEPLRTNEDVNNGVPIEYFRALSKTDINKCFKELLENLQSKGK